MPRSDTASFPLYSIRQSSPKASWLQGQWQNRSYLLMEEWQGHSAEEYAGWEIPCSQLWKRNQPQWGSGWQCLRARPSHWWLQTGLLTPGISSNGKFPTHFPTDISLPIVSDSAKVFQNSLEFLLISRHNSISPEGSVVKWAVWGSERGIHSSFSIGGDWTENPRERATRFSSWSNPQGEHCLQAADKEERQGQEANSQTTQPLCCSALPSGPHLPLSRPPGRVGRWHTTLESWSRTGTRGTWGRWGVGRTVGWRGICSLKGTNVVQVLFHPDSFSNVWRPEALSVQCSCPERSRDQSVGEGKSQAEEAGSCWRVDGLCTRRSGVQARAAPRWAGVEDGGRPPSPSLFSAGPAPLFQLRA